MWLNYDRRSPRGQMIVIVAVALTALVAMTGLIIDGGMALSNRRQVQNAADAAALAGTRVLSLDLKWRSVNASNPSPPSAPFANADAAVCTAINNALVYDTNSQQAIAPIDCVGGSNEAVYVDFNRGPLPNGLGQVGHGIPAGAQGVKVTPTGQSDTLLMGVVGISTIDVSADATAITGPGEPPLGQLMPFVAQNILTQWVPGDQYQIRSEDEGECDTSALPDSLAPAGTDADIVLAVAQLNADIDVIVAAPGQPSVPVAQPAGPLTFTGSVTVKLTADNGAKIYYTTDFSDPTTSSTKYSAPLTFTSTTVLKAIAESGNKTSDIGTFTYTVTTPPEAVTATPGNNTTFAAGASITVSLLTPTAGATIFYTTDGSTPTTSSSVYSGLLTFSNTTQLRAIASKAGVSSPVSIFNYIEAGDTLPPSATPPSGTEFATTLNVSLASATSGATIYYTLDGSAPTTSSSQYSGPLSLVATATIRAFASAGGNDSAIVDFSYTKTGPVCPELTSGNFGWVDFSGGSNSNDDLKEDIRHPENAEVGWYDRECASATDTQCRDVHDPADPADDHWLLEGTPGNRNVSLQIACDLYLGQIIYVPIWDGFHLAAKKPNGNNAVFHIIGFAAFRLDGIIDNKPNGSPSSDACGAGLSAGGPNNDKGFIGTYVDAFVGTQAAPCFPNATTGNPCANLSNDAFVINLAD